MNNNHLDLRKLKENYKADKFSSHYSFIKGMGSIFNFYGEIFFSNKYLSSNVSDYEAIKNDWDLVGTDLAKAINNFEW